MIAIHPGFDGMMKQLLRCFSVAQCFITVLITEADVNQLPFVDLLSLNQFRTYEGTLFDTTPSVVEIDVKEGVIYEFTFDIDIREDLPQVIDGFCKQPMRV